MDLTRWSDHAKTLSFHCDLECHTAFRKIKKKQTHHKLFVPQKKAVPLAFTVGYVLSLCKWPRTAVYVQDTHSNKTAGQNKSSLSD